MIGANIDDPYIAELKKLVLNQDAINAVADDLKIVYTPLHGTGNIPVRRVLKELGFKHVYVVPEQELPDGNFPTVSYPNPEAAEAFTLGLGMAKELDADLVLATDPDADRLGVYVKDSKTGEYHSLTGNMSGCLIGAYEISQRKEKQGLPADGAFVKSIVSTNLADAIAADYGVKLYEVLTGFKFIGQKMLEFETKGNGTYLFGMEESYGCLPGTYCRDKDAVVASMALCEAAAYYKTQGKTLWDAMLDLYEKYGYYKDDVKAITLKGIEGLAKIQEIIIQYVGIRQTRRCHCTCLQICDRILLVVSCFQHFVFPPVRYRAKTEILLWCQSRQHGSSRCKSSRAWRSSYGYRRADVRLMVHMSTNEYRLCDLFSLTNTGKTSINSL